MGLEMNAFETRGSRVGHEVKHHSEGVLFWLPANFHIPSRHPQLPHVIRLIKITNYIIETKRKECKVLRDALASSHVHAGQKQQHRALLLHQEQLFEYLMERMCGRGQLSAE